MVRKIKIASNPGKKNNIKQQNFWNQSSFWSDFLSLGSNPGKFLLNFQFRGKF